MSDRYPLIANSTTSRIEELATGDNLNLENSGIVGATTITSELFVGDLEGTAGYAITLTDAKNILTGTISTERLSGRYYIGVTTAENLQNAENILDGIISPDRLSGNYDINILGIAQTAIYLPFAENIVGGTVDAARLSGLYNIDISGISSFALDIPSRTYDISVAGTSNYSNVSGASTTTRDVTIVNTNSASTFYPALAPGIGTVQLNASSSKFSAIPSTGRLGINTSLPEYNLDVRGDIAFDGYLYAPVLPGLVKFATGTLSGATPNIISIDTSSLLPGDFVVDSPQLRIPNDTYIQSIGGGFVVLTKNHLVGGSESRTIRFDRGPRVGTGATTQVLTSRGDTLPPVWADAVASITVEVSEANNNVEYKLVLAENPSSQVQLKTDTADLTFNSTSNRLAVSGSVESPRFIGNLTGIASTAIDVIGGIADVQTLEVSGDSLLNDVNADILVATTLFGDGVNLTGIVTHITSGIGVVLDPANGKGRVRVDAYKPNGKTIFVTQAGDDNNTGLAENHAKKTIKAAAAIAVFGDTIKVFPGFYVEENPIVLKPTVSVEGGELRNVVVAPKYPNLDLYQVNNGCHIADMSFRENQAQSMTDGAAVVAFQPLLGVAVNRFFDAANLIRTNLDYIAKESVGFLTSGFSGFAGNHREQDAARLLENNLSYIAAETVGFLTSVSGLNFSVPGPGTTLDCFDDIRDIYNSVLYDLKANSNRKTIGAASTYFNSSGALQYITGIGVSQATVNAVQYSIGIAQSVINNVSPPISYQSGIGSIRQTLIPSVVPVVGGCVAVATTIRQLVGIVTTSIGIGNTNSVPALRFGVMLESDKCVSDVKDIWKCIIHDITRGGNSRSIDSGRIYYDSNWNLKPGILKNPQERAQTVSAVDYSFNVARAIVNNVTWGGFPVGLGINVSDAVYDATSGIVTITATNHGLVKDSSVRIVGLGFTCPSGIGTLVYPTGSQGSIFNVHNVIGVNTFSSVVGQSTLPHTYVSGGTVQRYTNIQNDFYQVKDLQLPNDPLTGFNNGITGCSNVISAIRSCVGIVTNIVGLGSSAFTVVGIRTTYPGNSGIGFTSHVRVTSATYDNTSGITTVLAPGLRAIVGETIELRDLTFSCNSGSGSTTQIFPSGVYGYDFPIIKTNSNGAIQVYVGASTLPHTYVGGGVVVERTVSVSTASYQNTTGIVTITASGLSIKTGDLVTIRNLNFSCSSGGGTTTIYPTGSQGYRFKVLDIVSDKPRAVTQATYNNTTGIANITAPGIGITVNDLVELQNLEFSCPGSPPNLLFPSGKNGTRFRVLTSVGSTFTVNVGPSTISHTYVSGGVAIGRTQTAGNTFTIQVGPSTITHSYVSGGVAIPPFSRGVGITPQGPYVKNCTNFISGSIGMKVNGFDAEPGDKDDIGVTGTMSVDSYTQFNQGGIGVSITNGAYAQLVSIFTICDDIAIFTGSGGQCDIVNSNSSFGRLGLYANGIGDATTGSTYHSTGVVEVEALARTNVLTVSGIGNYRPYDGQVCYFGEKFFFVETISVTNGGSNYTTAPRVTVSAPEGQNGITVQATTTIQNGSVISVNILNSGSQYRTPPIITIAPPFVGGTQATATVSSMQPIYYKVDSATLPSSGISTVSFLQSFNNTISVGTTVYFSRVSQQIVCSHSFEWVGSGNDINRAKPALGGVTVPENETVQKDGGIVIYTSTNQAGNFKIGDGIIINQATGQITGRDFTKALFTTMTPLILALSD